MIYIINYRLHKPDKDYEALYQAIREISGTYWHNTTSSWLVKSQLSAEQIYNLLDPNIDKDDEVAIFRLHGDWYGWLRKDDLEWLEGVMNQT
jgi:hypothetical protein